MARQQDRIEALAALRSEIPAPPGLARRTCHFVLAYAQRIAPRKRHLRKLTALISPPGGTAALRWPDLAATLAVMALAAMLLLPAVYQCRCQTRLATCQDRLRQFGVARVDLVRRSADRLPAAASDIRWAAAGVHAVALTAIGPPGLRGPEFGGCLGRNVLFADGHVALTSSAAEGGFVSEDVPR